MKFTAAALLIASVNAECPANLTIAAYTDTNCTTADANNTKVNLTAPFLKVYTDGVATGGNCTKVTGAGSHSTTCNATHLITSLFTDAECKTAQ
mgnify:CR=1 FL=1